MSEWSFPNAATPDGSANYYATRFSPVSEHNRIAAIIGWFYHLDEIVLKANDPGVARLKLDWWQSEINNFGSEDIRHPLSSALAPYCTEGWQKALLQNSLLATELRILKKTYLNTDDLLKHYQQFGGAQAQLLSHSPNDEICNTLGQFQSLVYMTINLRQCLERDYVCLPTDLLSKHQINSQQLLTGDINPSVAPLLKELIEDQLTVVAQQQKLAKENKNKYNTLLRLNAQTLALTKQLKKQNYQVLDTQIEISPLHYLWKAWRMR